MNLITSLQNIKVKNLVKLRDSRYRREAGMFLLEGVRELQRALKSDYELLSAYVCPELLSVEGRSTVSGLPDNMQIHVTKEVYAKIAVREASDGLLAVIKVKSFDWRDLEERKCPLLLVLENIEKPGNFGALVRSADGAGVDAVIVLDPKADIFNPHAIRASVGALFSRPIIASNHEKFIEYCHRNSINIVTASPFAKEFHFQADLAKATAIVLGSEAWGLSSVWDTVDTLQVKIPMCGIADSLNVSVAGAIVLYESLRQRMALSQI